LEEGRSQFHGDLAQSIQFCAAVYAMLKVNLFSKMKDCILEASMQVVESPNQTSPRSYSLNEYLELEGQSTVKHEYWDGEIVEMAGGSINHNEIVGNFHAYLKFGLRGTHCRSFMSDLRLWIPRHRKVLYPDVMVIFGEPIFYEKRNDTVTNPAIIMEVLSESTSAYDRGDKFRFYRSLPEMQEYILIDQYSFSVEQFSKTADEKWLLNEYESENDVLTLSSVDFQVSLRDIYERVKFEPVESVEVADDAAVTQE
jgi:Uma2 family endonuclease